MRPSVAIVELGPLLSLILNNLKTYGTDTKTTTPPITVTTPTGTTQKRSTQPGTTPTGKPPTGTTPTGKTPTGKPPTGKTPTGKTPTGKPPTGTTPTGKTPTTPTGSTPTGAPKILTVQEIVAIMEQCKKLFEAIEAMPGAVKDGLVTRAELKAFAKADGCPWSDERIEVLFVTVDVSPKDDTVTFYGE